jgi:hypothetical protein
LAYNAGLFFQAIEQKLDWKNLSDKGRYGEYLLAGIPDDLGELLKEAYKAGARIHTNSWGGGDAGAYDIQSRYVDLFTWENKDMQPAMTAKMAIRMARLMQGASLLLQRPKIA